MSSADLLRRAADCVESSSIGERKADEIGLLALHIIRLCGPADAGEETRMLLRLLERKA